MQKLSWALRLIAAAILLQTLFFKFTAAPESVELFRTLGLEPHGRIGIGVAELVASLLLLWPRAVVWGALLSLGLMAGALMSHVTKLGFAGEMGSLAALAAGVAACAAGLVWMHRADLLRLRRRPSAG